MLDTSNPEIYSGENSTAMYIVAIAIESVDSTGLLWRESCLPTYVVYTYMQADAKRICYVGIFSWTSPLHHIPEFSPHLLAILLRSSGDTSMDPMVPTPSVGINPMTASSTVRTSSTEGEQR